MGEFRIETERLILRGWREDDRAAYFDLHRSSEVRQYLGGVQTDVQIEQAIVELKASHAKNGYGRWVVERKADRRMIGLCGPRPYDRLGTPILGDIEIGWQLAADSWGQGYAKEAVSACLAWSWTHLVATRIVAITVPANRASWGLMERLGMVRRPDLDFGHPQFEPGHPLHAHITYVAERPRYTS